MSTVDNILPNFDTSKLKNAMRIQSTYDTISKMMTVKPRQIYFVTFVIVIVISYVIYKYMIKPFLDFKNYFKFRSTDDSPIFICKNNSECSLDKVKGPFDGTTLYKFRNNTAEDIQKLKEITKFDENQTGYAFDFMVYFDIDKFNFDGVGTINSDSKIKSDLDSNSDCKDNGVYNILTWGSKNKSVLECKLNSDKNKIIFNVYKKDGKIICHNFERIPWNKWVHLTVSVDTTKGYSELYVNGKLINTENLGSGIKEDFINNSGLVIGGNGNNGKLGFPGKIMYVKYFKNSLDPKSVYELYEYYKNKYAIDKEIYSITGDEDDNPDSCLYMNVPK